MTLKLENKKDFYRNQAEKATQIAGGVVGAIFGVTVAQDEATLKKVASGVVGSGIGVGVFHQLFKGFYDKYAQLRLDTYEKAERKQLTQKIIEKMIECAPNVSAEKIEGDLGDYELQELIVLEYALKTAQTPITERPLQEQFYINALITKIKEGNSYLKQIIIGG